MKSSNYKLTLIACYVGYITQAIVNNFSPLLFLTFRLEFSLTLKQVALLSSLNFLIQLCVDLLSAKFVDKLGYRISIIMAHLFCAVGIAGLAIFPDLFHVAYIGLLLSFTLYAIGGGLIEVLISPMVEACPTKNKAAHMSLLHSFYCWGQVLVVLLSTVYFSIAGIENWRVPAYIWSIIPLLNAICFLFVPIFSYSDRDSESHSSIKQMIQTKGFLLFCILMLCAGAAELSVSQWASAFAEAGLHISKAAGDLLGPCLFALLMGISRILSSQIIKKISIGKLIFLATSLCTLSYFLIALSPSAFLSLLGCAICGFSVGILWPGTYSMASAAYPTGGTTLFALLALAGDLGCSLGPALVGIASAQCGDDLRSGILLAAIFPILLLVCLVIGKKHFQNIV
jgi:fucose permease